MVSPRVRFLLFAVLFLGVKSAVIPVRTPAFLSAGGQTHSQSHNTITNRDNGDQYLSRRDPDSTFGNPSGDNDGPATDPHHIVLIVLFTGFASFFLVCAAILAWPKIVTTLRPHLDSLSSRQQVDLSWPAKLKPGAISRPAWRFPRPRHTCHTVQHWTPAMLAIDPTLVKHQSWPAPQDAISERPASPVELPATPVSLSAWGRRYSSRVSAFLQNPKKAVVGGKRASQASQEAAAGHEVVSQEVPPVPAIPEEHQRLI